MADEIAVSVDHVYKNFVLPHERVDSIKSLVTSKRSKKLGASETQHALKDISFEIKKGEFFGIVGRNGSGKSTMLKILAGIYQPSSGTIHTTGKLVPFIELGVGFNPELTGRENVFLNGALLGFSKSEIEAMYDEIVAFAELEKFMEQKLKNYSSGMQVRLAFSMATRSKTDILLVDEVLAVGDADFQRKCFDYFQQLKGGDTTVIFVSHNMNAIREYCDRALLIDKSEVVVVGDADVVAQHYSRMFIDTETETVEDKKKADDRWGNKAVTFGTPMLSAKRLSSQQELTINVKATVHQNVDGLLFGFSVKNNAKQVLLGTNTELEKQPIKSAKKGQTFDLTWVIPNIFSDGQYLIDLAIVQTNGQECDWWENALKFSVLKESEHASYLVSPPLGLNLQSHDG